MRTRAPDVSSLEGDERLRLFVALRLPDPVVEVLAAWQARELGGRQGVRLVPPGHLHLTVAFLGSRPAFERDAIVHALREASAAAPPPVYRAHRYRETQRVGMVVLREDAVAGEAGAWRGNVLADAIVLALEELGAYRRESRDWLPHVTVARFRERPGLSPPPPELSPFSPSEAALYHSVLRPSGAQYTVLQAVALGG